MSPRKQRLVSANHARQIEQLLAKAVQNRLSGDEAIDLAAAVATRHPGLANRYRELRSLLAVQAQWQETTERIAGQPRRLLSLEELADSEMRQARIASEAMAEIWQQELLSSSEVAQRLGAKASNREKVNTERRRSHLLGLPRQEGRMYLYPSFQIDPARREIYPEVKEVNRLLDAAADPWGVASWWISDSAYLEKGRPMDLVGTPEASALLRAAQALVEPLG